MFSLLKIIRPVWYYNLPQLKKNNNHWIDCEKISKVELEKIDYFNNYDDDKVSKLDASLQLWHNGFISNDPNKALLNHEEHLPYTLDDQYRFIRRFHKTTWVVITFLIRIFSFHNPFLELKSFLRSKDVKFIKSLNECVFAQEKFLSFDSALLKINPLVSIILPTLNRYDDLKNAINDIEQQSYKNFELIVVDQSDNFSHDFYKQFSQKIRIIRQKESTLVGKEQSNKRI